MRDLASRFPGRVFPLQADLLDISGLSGLAETAIQKGGALDILIHSASDFFPTDMPVAERDWDHFLDLNLKSPFFLTQAFVESLRTQNGAILHLVDIYSFVPLPRYLPYTMAKAALRQLTRQLATELAPHVRVNSIHPGTVLPPLDIPDDVQAELRSKVPMGRFGEARDVVEAAKFLLGNTYITGAELCVDGGRSLLSRS